MKEVFGTRQICRTVVNRTEGCPKSVIVCVCGPQREKKELGYNCVGPGSRAV